MNQCGSVSSFSSLKGIAMKQRILYPLFITIVCISPLLAQKPDVPDSVSAIKYNFVQFGRETWSFIKQPGHWDGGELLKIGVITGGSLLIAATADQPIRDAVLRDHRYDMSAPIVGGRIWGELYTPIILFSGFALHSIITGDMKTRKIAYEVGQASLYAGAITYIMKVAIGRARPYTNNGNKTFYPFGKIALKTDYQSFPGGHTTAGMVLSTVLARNTDSDWLKTLAYVPVAFTFVSRVYQDKHWTSDDFAGAGLGYFVATWVVDHHEVEQSRIHVSSIYPLTVSIRLD